MSAEQSSHMPAALLLLYVAALTWRPARGQCATVSVVNAVLENVRVMKSFDCKLYTPTLLHYKNCSSSTMKCLVKEATVLGMEMEVKSDLTRALIGRLKWSAVGVIKG